MTALRDQWVEKVYRGKDPFVGFPRGVYATNSHGWNSTHPKLAEAATSKNPCVVVEVGVWLGGSTIRMAKAMKDAGINGVVISVDTWLGSVEHWATADYFPMLCLDQGRPSLQRTFMANVLDAAVEDYVLPLPLDSLNAAELFRQFNRHADVIHLDGGHEYDLVAADIKAWWPRLRAGGIFIGDDYNPGGGWQGVMRAFDEAFPTPIEHEKGKCWIVKHQPPTQLEPLQNALTTLPPPPARVEL